MVNVLIKSYAHASALGIKPVDSIIDTVIVKKNTPPYKIVGYQLGHTYRKGEATFGRLKKYVSPIGGDEIIVYAISPSVARMIYKNKYNGTHPIYEVKISSRRV